MLVILEGLDNTGKTTIAKMLMPYYKIQGKNAILAKELSTPVGEQIKQLSREGKLTPELKSYLFPADRRLLLDGLGEIKKDDLGEELADVAIYLLGLSEILKIDLEDEILKKVYKNSKREYKIINGINTRVKEYEKK